MSIETWNGNVSAKGETLSAHREAARQESKRVEGVVRVTAPTAVYLYEDGCLTLAAFSS